MSELAGQVAEDGSPAAGARRFLGCSTPRAWVEWAVDNQYALLWDHANCEKKAASTALGTMFRYPDRDTLVEKMSRLAREELRHFEQVKGIIRKRGIPYTRVAPTRYAATLREAVRAGEPGRLTDVLICGAFIEARSCERFAALLPVLDSELAEFYRGLLSSEARHFRDYLALAKSAADESIDARVAHLRGIEAEIVTRPDRNFGFHSGPPA